MKPGKEYEVFIYNKFKLFFSSFDVKINDKIIGIQSGIKREIDISIKGNVNDINILYLVQCKDHNKPADVKIIGEFSAVIKDVGASKGFLICSSGFTKTIHTYARNLGIELFTVEDIDSEKWHVDIEIPVIYIHKKLEVTFNSEIKANDALVEKNKIGLEITYKDFEIVSTNKGVSRMKVADYINQEVENTKTDIEKVNQLAIENPDLLLLFAGVWVELKLTVGFAIEYKYYLKYLKPEEYSQISNHITNEKIPLSVKLKDNFKLTEEYIEIEKENTPITSTVFIEVEENLYPINDVVVDPSSFQLSR